MRADAGRLVFAFEVSVIGTNWMQVVNARSSGKAKVEYWQHVRDVWPDTPYTAMRARKLGAPASSERFLETAAYRGLPAARCGDRVAVGQARGVIVGHNSSANFDILFDDDSPKHAGQRLNVHPGDIQLETA